MYLKKQLVKLVLTLGVLGFLSAAPAPISGDKAPEIELPNMNGNLQKLSALKGKLVLLNFWSTWCVACNVVKAPEYVRLYNEYKDNTFGKASEFTIFSVAFDENKDKWLNRIAENGMNWSNHVIDQDSYYSTYWYVYGIQSIPASFLIDENGKIIGINLTYNQLTAELEKRKTGNKAPAPNPVVVLPPEPEPLFTPAEPTATEVFTIASTPPAEEPTSPPPTVVATTPEPVFQYPQVENTENKTQKVYKVQIATANTFNPQKFEHLAAIGKVETEQVSSTLKRILVGTYAAKTEATNALKKLKAKNYKDAFLVQRNQVVIMPKTTPTTPAANVVNNVYKIQLGVFKNPDPSKFTKLKDLGSFTTEAAANGLKRLLIGNFLSKNAAEIALKTVQQRGFSAPFLVNRDEVEVLTAANNLPTTTTTAKVTPPTTTLYSHTDKQKVRGKQTLLANNESATTNKLLLTSATQHPAFKNALIGKNAPKIELPNAQNQTKGLKFANNKYTLLYFWGSWNSTIATDHAFLNKMYSQYNAKGLEVCAVSFDKKAEMWQKALKKYPTQFKTHVIDTQGTNSPILQQYNPAYLPALFLVDENGMVIAENVAPEQLQNLLKKRLN